MSFSVVSTKIKCFFKTKYEWVVVPLFVLIIFAAAQLVCGIYPFGDSVMASYDMLAQVAPIIEHYFSVFSGESGLFHTFHLGGGMDVFGILAYCTVSPFTPIFLLFGQGKVVYAVSIVLPLKVACSACSALWFLNLRFKNIPSPYRAVLAVLYAFSGYLYVANTYIIWVDLMIYMPILAAGFIALAEKGSIKLFTVGLTLMIYACFSITCFSFFTVFPLAVVYFVICSRGEKRRVQIAKVCLSFVLAVAASLPILLPSFLASTVSARGTGLFTRVLSFYTSQQVRDGDMALHLYQKFSYIFCDAVFVCLAMVYFLRSKPKDLRARFLFVALVAILLPCLIDESMLLMNMGSYYSYALRFGFLVSFYLFYVASLAVDGLSLETKEKSLLKEKTPTRSYVATVVVAILTTVAAIAAFLLFEFVFSGKAENSSLLDKIESAFSSGRPFNDFFPKFAHSEGGMEGVVVLFIIAVLVFAVAAILVKTKCVRVGRVAPFICILAISQSVFYGFAMVEGDRQTGSAQNIDCFTQIVDLLEERDDENFKLKNYKDYVAADTPLITGAYSHSLFSSIADAKNLTFPVTYKYGGNTTNSTKSNGGTLFADSLIGYKYVVYKKDDESNAKNKTYFRDTGISVGDYRVYENLYSLPTAFVASIGDGEFLQTDDLFEHVDGFLKSFGTDGVTQLNLRVSRQDDGKYRVKFTSYGKGETYFTSFFPEHYSVYDGKEKYTRCYGYKTTSFTASVTIDGGEELSVDVIKKYCRAFTVPEESFVAAKDNAENNKVNYRLVKNGFEIDKVNANDGDFLFLSYTDIDGYKIKVNGKYTQPLKNSSDLLLIPLEEGENTVEITYSSPYISVMAIALAVGAIIIAAVVVAYKLKPKIFLKTTTALTVAAYALSIALVAFFFVFPTGIFVYKFCTRYFKWLFKV